MAGLYIHIPFCRSKCSYCAFYSRPVKDDDGEFYIKNVLKEYNCRKSESGENFRTIYIGGGTPSVLSCKTLEKLIDGLGDIEGLEEFTLEANPEDVDADICGFWLKNGINRLSMGVQSFDDKILKTIGRRHDALKAIEAYESAREAGFENISIDLIYGLPSQSLETWRNSLNRLFKLRPEHFSAYCLSVEPGSRLYASYQAGKVNIPDEDFVSECYDFLCKEADRHGYHHYEISNFALPGKESLHNSSYWNFTPFLGLGPAAFSFDGKNIRRSNPANLQDYLKSIEETGVAYIEEKECVREQLNDLIYTSLRTSEGLPAASLERLSPGASKVFESHAAKFLEDGLLNAVSPGRWKIDEEKWMISDWIIRELFFDEQTVLK